MTGRSGGHDYDWSANHQGGRSPGSRLVTTALMTQWFLCLKSEMFKIRYSLNSFSWGNFLKIVNNITSLNAIEEFCLANLVVTDTATHCDCILNDEEYQTLKVSCSQD